MSQLFAVTRTHGWQWNPARSLEEQEFWQPHADFMNPRVHDGFVLLAGPIEGTPDVLLIVRANHSDQIKMRLADGPWSRHGPLRIAHIHPWSFRLGSLTSRQN